MTWQHSLVSLQHGGWGLRAALWCCWGAPVMAALASQLLLCLNSRHPATNITASSKTTANTFYAGQPTCAAVCNVAIALANLVSLTPSSVCFSVKKLLAYCIMEPQSNPWVIPWMFILFFIPSYLKGSFYFSVELVSCLFTGRVPTCWGDPATCPTSFPC